MGLKSGRMLAVTDQNTSLFLNARAVELERRDHGATGGRQTDQLHEIAAPREVVAPTMLARVIQPHSFSGYRINDGGTLAFEAVATATGEREVVTVGCATSDERNDVFDFKRRTR